MQEEDSKHHLIQQYLYLRISDELASAAIEVLIKLPAFLMDLFHLIWPQEKQMAAFYRKYLSKRSKVRGAENQY